MMPPRSRRTHSGPRHSRSTRTWSRIVATATAALVPLLAACTPTDLPTAPTSVDVRRAAEAWDLAVYATPYRATVGETLSVFVHSSSPGAHILQLFRMGDNGGAGPSLHASAVVVAAPQPDCSAPIPGPVECDWQLNWRLPTVAAWESGIYVLQITSPRGRTALYPLVLRDARQHDFLVVIPQFTWQAYNDFGGSSLYQPRSSVGRPLATRVSFERPYLGYGGGGRAFEGGRTHELLVAEWLETRGYDVGYISDLDLASDGLLTTPRVGLLFAGHDEYWTWEQFDVVERLRDAGTHLAFFSGNNAYWKVNLEASSRTGRAAQVIYCLKDADAAIALGRAGRAAATTLFRLEPMARPEQTLYGVQYSHLAGSGLRPLVAASPLAGSEAALFLSLAGIAPGDSLPLLVGSEGDGIFSGPAAPGTIQVLFSSPSGGAGGAGDRYLTTFFRAPSGAGVFAAGNNEFGRGLTNRLQDADGRLGRLMRAVLDWMVSNASVGAVGEPATTGPSDTISTDIRRN